MNPNAKKLRTCGIIAGAGLLAGILGWYFFIKPAKKLDLDAAKYRTQMVSLEGQTSDLAQLGMNIQKFATSTFGTQEDEAGVKNAIEMHLQDLLDRSGLTWEGQIKNDNGAKSKGVYNEIVKRFIATGKLDAVIHFLYLLDRQQYRHRIDSVKITPQVNSQNVDLDFRYSTIVLAKTKGVNLSPTSYTSKTTAGNLNDSDRQKYAILSARDPFRRYIPAAKHVKRPRRHATRNPINPPPEIDLPERSLASANFVVSGLSRFGEKSIIRITDIRSDRSSKTYKIGDKVHGGTIVMVDYRLLPIPGKAKGKCGSRLVLKSGPDYWTVDLNQNLSQKRLLEPDELLDVLKKQKN